MLVRLLCAGLLSLALAEPAHAAEVWRTVASFYGGPTDPVPANEFMAYGKKFNPANAHYAAHPSLPQGTRLWVMNIANGLGLCVQVEDFGPSGEMEEKGRGIDLTPAGAKALGFNGLAEVEITYDKDHPCEF